MSLVLSAGDLALVQFPTFDIDGITLVSGLSNGDFGKTLVRNQFIDSTTVTVAEIGSSGIYEASFTPATVGLWYLQISTPYWDVYAEQWEVGPLPDDSVAAIATAVWAVDPRAGAFPAAGRMLDRLRVYLTNRNEIDFTAQQMVSYEDDGATVAQRWDLETDDGPPTLVINQFGSPTKRSDPLDPL